MTDEQSRIRSTFSRLSLADSAELTRVAQIHAISAALTDDPRMPRYEAIALAGMDDLEQRGCHEEAPYPAFL
jgi:hypothetical protein